VRRIKINFALKLNCFHPIHWNNSTSQIFERFWYVPILWVLLVEEIRVPRENHRPTTSHWQTLLHNVMSSTHLTMSGIQTHNVSGDRHW
jgi:hypothetical protein